MTSNKLKSAPWREIPFGKSQISHVARDDGSQLLASEIPLSPHPEKMTERLVHWAQYRPDRVFIAQRDEQGVWRTYTYSQTLDIVKRLGQFLLDSGVSVSRPLAILSENGVEHGMLALAALHIGEPYSPVTPAYSLRSTDFVKLRHVVELLSPGLIFVSDGSKYEKALAAVAGNTPILAVKPPETLSAMLYSQAVATTPTPEVDLAFQSVSSETIAKILFTSGSTGMPKGVINTHGNICTNWQQITQTFPFMAEEFEIIDWLPWNHTFGGNHNFGLTLYNGGSMYLDGGIPTPEGIKTTVENLREIAPTIYFNVPKGFAELIPYLKEEKNLREKFFSKLKMLFYAGAGMPQHVWDALEELALDTVGEKIMIGTGLGCTESSPSALFSTRPHGYAGLLGLPVPGLELKLVPVEGKMEARFRGGNITPGYWRNNEVTRLAFDEEGFYKTGDALRFADPENVNEGLLFDGRLSEDFKLNTGTWVHVGNLRSALLAAANGLFQDVVIAGHDKEFVSTIIFPDIEQAKRFLGLRAVADPKEIAANHEFRMAVQQILDEVAKSSTGSAMLVKRALVADFALSLDSGELTDKGSVNQRQVIQNRSHCLEQLYQEDLAENVIEVKIETVTGNR